MNSDCTLFLSSYDGGEDLWEGFFKAMSIQWPEMDMKVALNTETKSYSYPGFEIETLNSLRTDPSTQPWGERLIDALKRVKTEYVLLFLDDYWLARRVDDPFFRKTLQWMKDNPDVANFSFYPCMPGLNIPDLRFERFELRPTKCDYKLNCQAGLWRTKELISFIRPHESPWDWEVLGSIRAERYTQKFYSLRWNAPTVFYYGDSLTGCMVRRGRWVEENVLPVVKEYGLEIDFSKRGFEDFSDFLNPKPAPTRLQIILQGKVIEHIKAKIRRNRTRKLSLE